MRLDDWPERLNAFLARKHSFDWVECNCALFAADGVKATTGQDFGADYRGPKTKRGMLSRLRKVCGGDVEKAVTQELGEPLSNILMAKRGDVVSYDFGQGPALGICIGAKGVFVSESDGMLNIPLKQCRFAWGVI